MNNDGFGFLVAGPSDRRLEGEDLQHNVQSPGSGGPMKEAIDKESAQHRIGRAERLKHLEEHYKR